MQFLNVLYALKMIFPKSLIRALLTLCYLMLVTYATKS